MNTQKRLKAIGYCRISTNEDKQKHSLDHQKTMIKAYADLHGVNLIKTEVENATGTKISARPKLQELLAKKNFDVIICTKIDRLARNIVDLNNIVRDLQNVDKEVVFVENQIDTTTANGKLFLNILGSFSEFEAEIISERTKAGLAAARKKGVILGRPKKRKTKTGEQIRKIRSLRKARHSWNQISEMLGYKNKSGAFNFWKRNK